MNLIFTFTQGLGILTLRRTLSAGFLSTGSSKTLSRYSDHGKHSLQMDIVFWDTTVEVSGLHVESSNYRHLVSMFFICFSQPFVQFGFLVGSRRCWAYMLGFQVEWGEASMIQAERLLIMEALKDPLNERFFLLSDRWVVLIFTSFITEQRKIFYCVEKPVQKPNTGKCSLICCSCIPLYNFDYVYNYVMTSQKSFVDR
jgi:hypothetical protein